MHKAELIQLIAEQADLSVRDATVALNAILDEITLTLSRKEAVTLVGFGSFIVKQRAARKGKNPKTGEQIEIAAKYALTFKPGKALKAAVA